MQNFEEMSSSSSSRSGGEVTVLAKVDQSDAQLSRFTWAELVQEAAFVFQRDGSSPSSVLNFVKALSKFERVPESCTGETMKEFSDLFQQNIID